MTEATPPTPSLTAAEIEELEREARANVDYANDPDDGAKWKTMRGYRLARGFLFLLSSERRRGLEEAAAIAIYENDPGYEDIPWADLNPDCFARITCMAQARAVIRALISPSS